LPSLEALENKGVRLELAKDFYFFCAIYLPHYFLLDGAKFHREMMQELTDTNNKRLEIIGFRGSAKSTIGSTALPIWMALVHPELYPFIIVCADTNDQAKLMIASIKTEFDNNERILRDFGSIEYRKIHDPNPEPSMESDEDWQAKNMLLHNGVRIMARSRGQKFRGLKHRQYRPHVIIVDDPEDIVWVRSKENRMTTDRWMRGEVLPSLAKDGRLIVIGNWLHEDALMARLKKTKQFKVLEYSLINEKNQITWPAMYPDQASLDRKRDETGEVAWMREYLLKIVPEEGVLIRPEDIHYYDSIPANSKPGQRGHGVDLAISTEESADYTAEVVGHVYHIDGAHKIFIQPHPLNAHMDFYNTMEYFKNLPGARRDMFFVEDVAYQKAAIQEMIRAMMPVTPMRPIADKYSRLQVCSRYIKNGQVLFPRNGCENLIMQLLSFGGTDKDDLVDGLTNMILGLVENGLGFKRVVSIGGF
jgi:phage terminase large subunit-like protein